jgi:DNA-binding SARP family transcriptional activator
LIVRDGDSYRLSLPPGSDSDLASFEAAMKDGRAARAQGDVEGARAAFETALDLYRGDLLPDVGPAEWVVEERERYRMDAADAAQDLAALELAAGNAAASAAACERGLRIDRHRDHLWRMRIQAAERAGDRAGSAHAKKAYEGVLAELGLLPAAAGEPPGTSS